MHKGITVGAIVFLLALTTRIMVPEITELIITTGISLIISLPIILPPILWIYGLFNSINHTVRISNAISGCISPILFFGHYVSFLFAPLSEITKTNIFKALEQKALFIKNLSLIFNNFVDFSRKYYYETQTILNLNAYPVLYNMLALILLLLLILIVSNEYYFATQRKQLFPQYQIAVYIIGVYGYCMMGIFIIPFIWFVMLHILA